MSATARRHNRPYFPSAVTALTVNQVGILGVSLVRDEGFWIGLTAQMIHTGILGVLISASVMSWITWHRDLVPVTVTVRPENPTE